MEIISRIGKRLRKYWVFVLAVPLVFGSLGWLLPVGKSFSHYQASATIWLGSYGDANYNQAENVRILLSNEPFYKEYLPELWKKDQTNFPADLTVTVLKNTMVQIAYTDNSRQQAAAITNQVADRFIARDHQAYTAKKQIISDTLKRLDRAPQGTTDTAQLYYQLKSAELRNKPAQILQRANPGTARGSAAFSSKKRSALGLVFGLTLVFFMAAWPELVRERDKRKEGGV
ncbi:hypothetical protein [Sporolactobacillus spathodeae]|uniref:Teichuronic acid biosynthesis protein TuaF n=1 Tax=Sporolactobacillus spathodeae TaxID=1465502 RepID=A0ABS2QAK1_9BACL|nr:hypothetical protein [Sporolactobacillus spathodeae]MBM7658780.1 teichuronic acid biosynthesis protein TuaF [Sporolactobacillus spathodeae]